MTDSFNRLGTETSPYLRQHRDNPVHWWPWGEAAFAAAHARNVPVLLSVGYAACHWCHVMAHESFENEDLAAQMNRDFVCIKVDREERPDVDAIYMKALHVMGEHGGWPLTMFLTPDRKPFWGGTYFPPAPRYGRPGFGQVLTQLAKVWSEAGDKIAEQSEALTTAIAERAQERLRDGLSMDMLDDAAAHLLTFLDQDHGGLRGAPKFPMPFVWDFIWRAFRRTGDARFKDAAVHTLTRICQGGIYDHLGGGYARYSTDALWLVPHFEKMLYDNVLMIDAMTSVWQHTADPLFATRIAETIAWLERDMRGENGGFAAAYDADSEGVEGKFYVWDDAEIDALLGADAALFKDAYNVLPGGNWEGHTVLNRNAATRVFTDTEENKLSTARAILFAERAKRIAPGRDDKVLADWNGMAIAAVARAGFVFAKPEWIARAHAAFDAVTATMIWTDHAGRKRLAHSYCGGRRQDVDMLDDYAHMAAAAVSLFEIIADTAFLDFAVAWVETADALFWSVDGGGYYQSPHDATDLIVRTRSANDSAVPSGNGMMATVLARLYHLTGNDTYRERAQAVVNAFEVEAMKSFPHAVQVLIGYDLLVNAVQVVLVGDNRAALLAAVAAQSQPALVLQQVHDGQTLPPAHPAHGKTAVGGNATAYVCRGTVCSAPVTTPADLRAALAGGQG